jgi:excisionase family DNA binding protein
MDPEGHRGGSSTQTSRESDIAGSEHPICGEMSARSDYDDDELVTVAVAAEIANRSVRTIRRAYLSGRLIAHRDGNGRGVRIRYRDLRDWMMAGPIATTASTALRAPEPAAGRNRVRRPVNGHGPSENLRLLNAARRLRANGARGRANAVALPVAGSPEARKA